MAANEKLESFLAAQEPAPADTPTPPAPEPQEPSKPEPQQPEPDKGKTATATPEPADEPDDDDAPDARPGEPAVPRHALIDERNKRRDWKEKAARAEGEAAELRKQLEALQKPPPPPQQQQQQPAQQFQFTPWEVDPARRYQEELVNEKFERSELMMRSKHGDEVVDQLINDFAQLTAQNPTLRMQLFAQRDPFGWAHKEVERQRLLREVGDDPTSYEQKLRAKWEAEMAARQPPQVALPQNTPAPAMPPSLANVRSAAPRAAPQWSGPLSDDQVAADMRERRMAQRR